MNTVLSAFVPFAVPKLSGIKNPYRKLVRVLLSRAHAKKITSLATVAAAVAVTISPRVTLANIPTSQSSTIPLPKNIETINLTFNQPVENSILTQTYHQYHRAIDLAAPIGTPIYPIRPGTVTQVSRSYRGLGNAVTVVHAENVVSVYGHMDSIAVSEGDRVDLDTKLGFVGSTGFSSGPHLHLEILEDGSYLNPLEYLD